ncbi:MAG TPA: hypothetical protein VNH20_01580 [Candidatus Dormibacteraeota bacterium]|nr:hypothetical protein [Candidatus Dormibacteraeota bacterium]
MLYLGRPRTNRWVTTVHVPAREVFAVAEQVMGLPPFSFRVIDGNTAEVAQVLANGFFGQWTKVKKPKTKVRIECRLGDRGTELTIVAQGQRSATIRALNLIRILTRGERDAATIYRLRTISPGPCTLVQSWAGTGYPLFLGPDYQAARGLPVRPASPLRAIEQKGRWVLVQAGLGEGSQEGWIEADQLVPDVLAARGGQP